MSNSTVIARARAVDLGYSKVKMTLGRAPQSGDIQATSFPAIAPVLKSGFARQMSGAQQPEGCVVAVGGVSYFVGPGALQRGSGSEARIVGEDYSASDKYLALFRGSLHGIAQHAGAASHLVIRHLVLGLPLTTYFDAFERLSERATGNHQMGGADQQLTVTIERVRVIVQPQGALIHFGYRNGGKPLDGLTLVVDPGGGTLDWYLADGKIPLWERSGAYPKSMIACACAVADRINPKWRQQPAIMERIDEAIRLGKDRFTVQGEHFALADYRPAVDQVLDESLDQMFSTMGSLDDVDHILLVGGGASLFRDRLSRRQPRLKRIIRMDDDPVYSNVRGFHIVAEADSAASTAR